MKILWTIALIFCFLPADAGSLRGKKFDFICADTVFTDPYIDIDKTITSPVRCRYIHGGFADGTRFSFYFPEKEDYAGRFFQYITPFPDSETAAQGYAEHISPIVFSIQSGAYFVETNEGGSLDFTDTSKSREASIGAYRANAACAEFSRHVAQLIYDCPRPYGYCFGGSGGAYRTTGAMESTEGVWDGAVPFVLGSPQAIPTVFGVRMYALRMLRDKMPDIVDALLPGGSGDPYATLTAEQRQVLQECTRMGFPIKSWYGYEYMDVHGFRVLYGSVVAMDPTYFSYDFWNTPGYLGYDNPASLQRDRVQVKAVVTRVLGQDEAEELGVALPMDESERGTADRSWASLGADGAKPAGYELSVEADGIDMLGDLIVLSGEGKGLTLQLSMTRGRYAGLDSVNPMSAISKLHVGDSVQVDNSNLLASETLYRHQMPSKDFYVWNQFRGYGDVPVYPQRPMLLGPIFCMGAAGCVPDGAIHGKMILLCSVYDRESFAWQGDWYRNRVRSHIGGQGEEASFRLWYTDRALHGDSDADDPLHAVSYMSTLYQALLDVSRWVEEGVEPSHTTDYEIVDGQVVLGSDGSSRGGVQPVAVALIDGKERADIRPGESVTATVTVDVPAGTGTLVRAEWCTDGSGTYSIPVDLTKAVYSQDGGHAEFTTTLSFDEPGTYFPTCRVYSERNGDPASTFTLIPNLAKLRVVVNE